MSRVHPWAGDVLGMGRGWGQRETGQRGTERGTERDRDGAGMGAEEALRERQHLIPEQNGNGCKRHQGDSF